MAGPTAAATRSGERVVPTAAMRVGFDLSSMNSGGFAKVATDWVLSYPQSEYILAFLRRYLPIFRFPKLGWYFVTRYEDVREALSRDDAFPVLWAGKMQELTGAL